MILSEFPNLKPKHFGFLGDSDDLFSVTGCKGTLSFSNLQENLKLAALLFFWLPSSIRFGSAKVLGKIGYW